MQNICLINFMNYLTNYPLYILNLKILKHPIICLFYFKGVCVCAPRHVYVYHEYAAQVDPMQLESQQF